MTVLNIIQILVSILLVIIILMQVKGQGTGLFGAADNSFRTRRGIELQLLRFTVALIVVFLGLSIASARLF
ncbi:hypothetical protein GBAR_LOCUS5052 [Geodia barretti]|uniref:Probable protein-export membrane protein SecG n=1 Tax=Geodia barretti TaxID=519541 RepID=A0AA35R948_GEOBA|nr:hypothetical protein GBAR_LOCUS5052 [Geodia barretti]